MTTWRIIPMSVDRQVRVDDLAAVGAGSRLRVADGLHDVGLDERAAVDHRRVRRRELERRHRDALAERAVREVDLAPLA